MSAAGIARWLAHGPEPVRPVVVKTCWLCFGTGYYSRDYPDGRCVSEACSNCRGRGRVATESGEA